MDTPAPIPTPWQEYWRRVRSQVVHLTAFLLLCCGVALAWREVARPLSFPGQAEIIQASVTSPEAGVLTNLCLSSFQQVKAGDLLGEIYPGETSPKGTEQAVFVKPIHLVAPIAGAITAIHHQSGEHVLAGQALITITSQECHRIIGLVPPTLAVVPQPGMDVEIRTRAHGKKKGRTKIMAVGPNWESTTNVFSHPLSSRGVPVESIGRPVSINIPAGLQLLPGEPLEITLLK